MFALPTLCDFPLNCCAFYAQDSVAIETVSGDVGKMSRLSDTFWSEKVSENFKLINFLCL